MSAPIASYEFADDAWSCVCRLLPDRLLLDWRRGDEWTSRCIEFRYCAESCTPDFEVRYSLRVRGLLYTWITGSILIFAAGIALYYLGRGYLPEPRDRQAPPLIVFFTLGSALVSIILFAMLPGRFRDRHVRRCATYRRRADGAPYFFLAMTEHPADAVDFLAAVRRAERWKSNLAEAPADGFERFVLGVITAIKKTHGSDPGFATSVQVKPN